jgi:hypothetical protein
MITDEDLTPFEFSDFWDDDTDDEAPSSQTIEPDYIKRHIDRIPHYGDNSRWRLASHLEMFESLNPNGTLTAEQRQAVDNFAIGWQALEEGEYSGCEMDFPECQYVAVGLDLVRAIELGDSWRRTEKGLTAKAEIDKYVQTAVIAGAKHEAHIQKLDHKLKQELSLVQGQLLSDKALATMSFQQRLLLLRANHQAKGQIQQNSFAQNLKAIQASPQQAIAMQQKRGAFNAYINAKDFDASDYDYLNLGTSTPPETQTQAKTPQVSNIERFWTLTGNWGEFGLYFGAGLSASLIVRAVPVLIPSAVILFPAVGLGLGLFSLTADGPAKLRSQLILIAVGTALLAANWDAWTAWASANSQMLILTATGSVITIGFVAAQVWSKLNHE